MLKRVLVANRGEIAVRIMRAARTLAISPVAVFSEADRDALHVRVADDAVEIGPPAAAESYLNIERIIDAAKQAGCDCVHPGYGFLAERAVFARAVIDAGLVWIGPTAEAIELLGDKVASRLTMENAGVPVTPGFASENAEVDADEYRAAAEKIGYPVLIKAAAGGGGKGMRVVRGPDEFAEGLEGAAREAKGAFGDPRVFIERYVEKPRHIEFQVFADEHGDAVHLFERECSIQRRHQKVIEETPSTALTPGMRARMGEAAVKAVKASNYVNAGTVEFLFDDPRRQFYFLEVNTRIQVEHPVTEETTGIDLVAAQFHVAAGERLPWAQDEITQRGHAIQARIYAEDPAAGFLPAAGPLLYLREPTGPGVRVDSGVVQDVDVPVHYDPIMAKVIGTGPDRETARVRLIHALAGYVALGVPTTAPFLRDVLAHPEFVAGRTYTDFIPTHFHGWTGRDAEAETVALAVAAGVGERSPGSAGPGVPADATDGAASRIPGPWATLGLWRIGVR
ncbi:MAG: Acetyl-/propionyl-coenzyme A carboxylase alpha chain [Calditrichaeota bacterium]|nr:Acetyl-/propionyl-coenzyme A carboxylase alpha chain [Calditrichota bacterium]